VPPLPWQGLIKALLPTTRDDPEWFTRLAGLADSRNGLHLAILVEPYLQYILEGKKTVESRFGLRRRAPHGQVHAGDVLLLKRAGGPIVGLCEVGDTWFYRLDPASWQTIRRDFTVALCAEDPVFWETRSAASFATLMRIRHVRSIGPLAIAKRDRRGWIVLKPSRPELDVDTNAAVAVDGEPREVVSQNGRPCVLAFAGPIGSGKSAVSAAVAAELGWPRASFGDCVREEARRRGLDALSRDVLQALGETLIGEGWDAFCSGVLQNSGWRPGSHLVVDGVRHVEAITTLRKLTAPSSLYLVYLEAPEEARVQRLRARGVVDGAERRRFEAHSTEREVKSRLAELADLHVNTSVSAESAAQSVVRRLVRVAERGLL
jgi:dephospho-CoA kinase